LLFIEAFSTKKEFTLTKCKRRDLNRYKQHLIRLKSSTAPQSGSNYVQSGRANDTINNIFNSSYNYLEFCSNDFIVVFWFLKSAQ